MQSERLADTPLDAVSVHGLAHGARHSDAQAGRGAHRNGVGWIGGKAKGGE